MLNYKLEKRQQPQLPRSSEELEDLHKLLHFPEEVALRLAETEYQLFYQVQPCDYLRHVTHDLTLTQTRSPSRPPPSPSSSSTSSSYHHHHHHHHHHQHHQHQYQYQQYTRDLPTTINSATQTEEETTWLGGDSTTSHSVQTLINRFNEVSSWVTHTITSGATIEERQALLSCLLRVAQTCWNTGNFNSAMEIIAGLNGVAAFEDCVGL
ncbi:hypothetical protein PV325_003661 [Microctonus aethiopoides]|nr:hypothetical protein PV325_003661 [Microctonus aethiopoides]